MRDFKNSVKIRVLCSLLESGNCVEDGKLFFFIPLNFCNKASFIHSHHITFYKFWTSKVGVEE